MRARRNPIGPIAPWRRQAARKAARKRHEGDPVESPAVRRMVRPVEPLGGLPDRLYHGTQDIDAVLSEGLQIEAAVDQYSEGRVWCWEYDPIDPDESEEDEDWPIEWGKITWDLWYRTLSKEGRRSLREQTGVAIRSRSDLGQAISLFWTARRPESIVSFARDGSPVLELDPRRLPVFGWFCPDMLCKDEVVLVLPAKDFQGGPDAFTAVWTKE